MIGEIPEGKRINPDDVIIKDEILSKGTFGRSKKGQLKKDNSDVTIHFQISKKADDLNVNQNAILIHGNLNHPAIIPFLGFFDNADQFNFVLPYMKNGDLSKIFSSIEKGKIPEGWNNTKMLINIIGIVSGMKYLHNNSVIHCDLKPTNIILDDNFYPLITDFLVSKIYKKEEISKYSNGRGTIRYAAPEVFIKGKNTFKSDVFSFSIVLFQLATNRPIYYDFKMKVSQLDLYEAIKLGKRPSLDGVEIPQTLSQLIQICWDADPAKRPTFDEIYSTIIQNLSSIIQGYQDIDENEVQEYIRKTK